MPSGVVYVSACILIIVLVVAIPTILIWYVFFIKKLCRLLTSTQVKDNADSSKEEEE